MVERAMLVDRWLELTRNILPAMAQAERWPIRYDHCFMRVCLDEAVDAPWPLVVKRPAIWHASDDQLEKAVCVAETLAAHPDRLLEMNARSLRRRAARR